MRLKGGQCGVACFGVIATVLYVIGSFTSNSAVTLTAICFGCILLVCGGFMFYKNVSLLICKRIMKEPNVIIIVLVAIFNLILDFILPSSSFSWMNGIIYFLVTILIILIDVMKVKSRNMVIIGYSAFVTVNLYNIYGTTFGDDNVGYTLATYKVENEEVIIWKRSIKRSIYIKFY